MDERRLITVSQAEDRYGISKWTLYLWAGQGKVPSYKIGKLRRFSVETWTSTLTSSREIRACNDNDHWLYYLV